MVKVFKQYDSSVNTLTDLEIPAPSQETVTGTKVIDASENGRIYFLASQNEFPTTLPAPQSGLHFTFFVRQAPLGVSYTIVTHSGAEILAGQVYSSDGVDADSETAFTATTITFVQGASVIGDSADVWSDGVNWYARCYCNVSTGITITG